MSKKLVVTPKKLRICGNSHSDISNNYPHTNIDKNTKLTLKLHNNTYCEKYFLNSSTPTQLIISN